MRSYYIAGNWKMHKTVSESVALAKDLKDKLSGCGEKLSWPRPSPRSRPCPRS